MRPDRVESDAYQAGDGAKAPAPEPAVDDRELAPGTLLDLDLLAGFERICESRADANAIYLRDPRSKRGKVQYLSLTYGDLREETEAWVKYLQSSGVGAGDRVALMFPLGFAVVAATYAALRLGCELCVLDAAVADADALLEYGPTTVLGTSDVIDRLQCRSLGLGLVLEVSNPLQRLGSGLRLHWKQKHEVKRMESSLSFQTAGEDGQSKIVTMSARSISLLSLDLKRELAAQEGGVALAMRPLELVFLTAWGVGNVVLGDGGDLPEKTENRRMMEAIDDLSVSLLACSRARFERLLRETKRAKQTGASLRKALLTSDGESLQGLQDEARSRFPEVAVHAVFGTQAIPYLAIRDWSADAPVKRQIGSAARYVGRVLSGVSAVIDIPQWLSDEDEGDGDSAAKREAPWLEIGRLNVRYEDDDGEGHETRRYGFLNATRDLWIVGQTRSAVRTQFGEFIPARCEMAFCRHGNVQNAYLLSIKSKGQTRAGLLVVVKDGAVPKGDREESKFKAELMQLGAEFDETKMILDFFFTDKEPSRDAVTQEVDYARLSKKYSRRSVWRSLF